MATDVEETSVRAWLGRRDLTVDELVDTAESLLPSVAPAQSRYKVRERPDVRTIRYYVTEGLLPKPFGYEGGRARYGGTHLIRLLLIKRLQVEHETLARIQARMKGASDEDVIAALLRGIEPRATRNAPPRPPGLEETPLDQAPDAAPAAPRRLELVPGASLEVPEAILKNPADRRRLAGSLETLSAWLRATLTDDE